MIEQPNYLHQTAQGYMAHLKRRYLSDASDWSSCPVYCISFGTNCRWVDCPRIFYRWFLECFFLALVIAVAGWIIEGIFGKKITPFGRGIVGFLVSALVIWGAQFIVGGVHASIIGALLAALVIGIIDLFIPVATPFKHNLNGDERKD